MNVDKNLADSKLFNSYLDLSFEALGEEKLIKLVVFLD
jgi:hypothetical protein